MLNRMVLTVCRSEVIMIQKHSAHIFFYRPYFVDDINNDENMACTAFKMIMYEQFRHALTRHDPKTDLPWLVGTILLKLKD